MKANYTIGEKDRLYLSGYFGRDRFMFTEQQGYSWGNRTATLRWNHLISNRLFFNLTSYFSDYTYELMLGETQTDRFEWDSRIRSTALKPEFSYSLNAENKMYFGGELLYYRFDPAHAIVYVLDNEVNIRYDFAYKSKGMYEWIPSVHYSHIGTIRYWLVTSCWFATPLKWPPSGSPGKVSDTISPPSFFW